MHNQCPNNQLADEGRFDDGNGFPGPGEDWLKEAQRVVALTGAGISTESGIPDFRGPQGVWTKDPERKNSPISATTCPIPRSGRKPGVRVQTRRSGRHNPAPVTWRWPGWNRSANSTPSSPRNRWTASTRRKQPGDRHRDPRHTSQGPLYVVRLPGRDGRGPQTP
ncbi:MAG: hypothetical protein CM1200mP20_07320 [Pseudomonadota bacterium]|nr:MAG: hypothetical protein CM1200mP20_07320 [Pseudomonadota bacterium]